MRQTGKWWHWLCSQLLQDTFPHLLVTALLYRVLILRADHCYGTILLSLIQF